MTINQYVYCVYNNNNNTQNYVSSIVNRPEGFPTVILVAKIKIQLFIRF